jgi:hypothetical protein
MIIYFLSIFLPFYSYMETDWRGHIHLANAVGKLQQLIVGDSQAMQVAMQQTVRLINKMVLH